MFVAIRFSWRRFRHQMDHLVLMWKQTLTLPPPPRSSVCNANIACTTRTEPLIVRFWNGRHQTTCLLIVHLLGDLLTVDCWFFPEWNQWDFSWGSRENRRTSVRVESQSKVLHRAVTIVEFRMLLFSVKYVHWPLTYFSPHRPRKGYRD